MRQLSSTTRNSVFERMGEECLFCGLSREEHRDKNGRDLEIHHLIPKRAGGSDDIQNLIPVCRSCHAVLESTQGKALARLKQKQSRDRELAELERDREHLQRSLEMAIDVIGSWGDLYHSPANYTIYVVHEGSLGTSNLLYAGRELDKAEKVFENADRHATLETANVNVSDWTEGISSQFDAQLDRIEDAATTTEDRAGTIQNLLEGELR